MRVFVALMLPEALWEAVGALQGALGCGRPVAEENLHLTLVFLGQQERPALEAVHEALAEVSFAPFTLELAGLETWGPAERPAALVLGVRPSPALAALRAKVAAAVRHAGIELDRSRFRPHVTIARFGRGAGEAQAVRLGHLLESRGDVVLPPWRVGGFAMLRSHLTREGADYEVLAEYPEG